MSVGSAGIATALVAFAACAVLVDTARRAALRRGWLDLPNDRSLHVRPTPRVGGLGILAALLAGGATAAATLPVQPIPLITLLGLGIAVALVSLWDDLGGLSPLARLAVHVVVATTAVGILGPLSIPSGPAGLEPPPLLAATLTVFWITGFINAFNFMDGIDGIAGGQALVAGAGWAFAGWWTGQPLPLALGLSLAAGAAAFLFYNWSPASIFMGDVGSALLGFLLAAVPLGAGPSRPFAPAVLLMVWPFLFDASFTLLRRAWRREPLLRPHRTHLYQRLVQTGWSHAEVAALYIAMGSVCAAAAVAMLTQAITSHGVAGVVAAGTAGALWLTVTQAERRIPRASPLET
jgi:UDP-N-acetylmuramyl pentapeptide phosphotransferase/UDP-N-acetylglucosamine-1-phosphate transferase